MTYCPTPWSASSRTRSSRKRARATIDVRNVRAPVGIHVAAGPPVRIGIGQSQAHGVVEYVRWRVDLDVQGSPERQ